LLNPFHDDDDELEDDDGGDDSGSEDEEGGLGDGSSVGCVPCFVSRCSVFFLEGDV
jgi:hypothetical protein